jgi:hypothetical protein
MPRQIHPAIGAVAKALGLLIEVRLLSLAETSSFMLICKSELRETKEMSRRSSQARSGAGYLFRHATARRAAQRKGGDEESYGAYAGACRAGLQLFLRTYVQRSIRCVFCAPAGGGYLT